jgi:hypothetical protein
MRVRAQFEFESYCLVVVLIRENSSISAGTVRTTTQAPEVNLLATKTAAAAVAVRSARCR